MKKSTTDSAKLDPNIVVTIDAGAHLELLMHNVGTRIQVVDFSSETVRQAYVMGTYQMYLSHKIPRGEELVCLFPNHRVEKKQVIKCSSYYSLSSFNKDINEAFTDSLDKTDLCNSIKFAVCYGKHVFVCAGITGVIQIVWASHVNRTNAGNVANTIYTNVPLILNMDGTARVKGLYILKPLVHDESDLDRIPITATSPTFMYDKDHALFVCEVRTERPKPVGLHTVSRKEALAMVSATTKPINVTRGEVNPFAASIDMEEDIEVSSDSFGQGRGSDVDAGTPRSVLYFRDTSINLSRPISRTPPIVKSDGEENAKNKDDE